MKAVIWMGLVLAGLTHVASAGENYRLRCEGDTFEAPMTIEVEGGRATASASWDGPGSAIFSADYKDLAVIDLNGELTITQPVVVGHKPAFHVTLRTARNGKLRGVLHVDPNDGQDMSFDGAVSCERR